MQKELDRGESSKEICPEWIQIIDLITKMSHQMRFILLLVFSFWLIFYTCFLAWYTNVMYKISLDKELVPINEILFKERLLDHTQSASTSYFFFEKFAQEKVEALS